jgi:hypothetical protein
MEMDLEFDSAEFDVAGRISADDAGDVVDFRAEMIGEKKIGQKRARN